MQSNQGRKNQYVRSGITPRELQGKKRRLRRPPTARRLTTIAIVLVVIALAIFGLTRVFRGSSQSVRINATPQDNIQAFGENVLYYDGMTLHCVSPNGTSNWQYPVGTGGDFYCTGTSVVAWNDNQIHVINKDGKPTYNDRMEDTIRFARTGGEYVAICIGDELNSTVRVCTLTGTLMENTNFTNLYLLDIGFFYNKDQLMWVLGLDIQGNTPVMNLSTYEPGKMSTGAVELQDQLVYKIYVHNNMLMVVDTTKIRAFNYKCVEQTDIEPVLVYGWQVKQTRTNGRNTYALLEKMPTSSDVSAFSEIRLLTNYEVRSHRLMTPCFASGISEKGIYAFGEQVIYYAPFGSTTFKATHLSFPLTELVCMLDGGRAVMVTGNDVYILKLPT